MVHAKRGRGLVGAYNKKERGPGASVRKRTAYKKNANKQGVREKERDREDGFFRKDEIDMGGKGAYTCY